MASNQEFLLVAHRFGLNELKTQQKTSINAVLEGKDVFLSTKTGSGKSLTYQAIPVIGEHRRKNWLVVVVSPLISIMREQTIYLQSLGIKAAFIGQADHQKVIDVFADEIKVVFGTPETLVDTDKWRDMLKTEGVKKRLKLVVVDEAHTIHHWGYASEDGKVPFRAAFARVGELRSLCFHDGVAPPMLAITATASPLARKTLRRELCMKLDVTEIVDSPSRENVKLHVKKLVPADQDLEETFYWLIEEITEHGAETPRVLVFCKNKDDTGRINAMLLRTLGKHYFPDKGQTIPVVHIYDRDTTDATKAIIAEDMNNANGNIRILLATNSAGMGVNFKNTTRVINFGPPRDLDTLVQQIGRVGRLGEPSHAILLYNGRQLKKVETSVLEYIHGKQCRRKIIMSAYMATEREDATVDLHDCCDVCHVECKCAGDDCSIPEHPACTSSSVRDVEELTKVRQATQNDKDLLLQSLENLRVSILRNHGQGQHEVISADLIHGLTKPVIDSVIGHCDCITSVDDLMDSCNVLSFELAFSIYNSFLEIFSDMPEHLSDED